MRNEEIQELITCPKIIVKDPKKDFKTENRYHRNKFILACENDRNITFTVRLRKHEIFSEDFSVMLDYYVPELDKEIKLIRYNGAHGKHTNKVLNNLSFEGALHIHKATQEAIELGILSENYAELTNKYSTFEEALVSFWKDVNIRDDINKYFPDYNRRQLDLFKDQVIQ